LTESEIQKEIIKVLELNGCMVFRLNSGRARNNIRLCPSGTPDLLAITRHGIPYFIEVKTEDGTLSPDQIDMIARLNRRNQKVIVAHDIKDVSWIR